MRSSVIVALSAFGAIVSAVPQFGRPGGPGGPGRPGPRPPAIPATPLDPATPICDLSNIAQPIAPTPLPVPGEGLRLALVAVGRGTQNYTCGADGTVAPAQIGAVADLFDASCNIANGAPIGGLIGTHFFVDTTTPEFDVPAPLGNTRLKRDAGSPAPANTNGDVAWLKLKSQTDGTTGSVKEIYRLRTKGGAAPATCAERDGAGTFEVQYETEYWFYASA